VYILGRLSGQFSGSQEAFGATFRVISGYQKAGTSFPKRIIGRILQPGSDFIVAS
jgi:hypothetical protein